MRWPIRLPLLIVVLVAVLVSAGCLILRSQGVKEQVTSQLQAIYGGSLAIDDVDVGLNTSSLAGVKLYEKGTAEVPQPWASAETVRADVSVLQMLQGRTPPGNLTLTRAAVTLRFSANGALLTSLPGTSATTAATVGKLPNLRIEHGRIVLKRVGGTALVIPDVAIDLRRKGGRYILDGTAGSPGSGWGKWTMYGSFAPGDEQLGFTLQTDQPVLVTQAMLDALPFVPPSVWQEFKGRGLARMAVRLRLDLGRGETHYRVEMELHEATIQVPAVDLEATSARGTIVIDDGVVTLHGVQGKAFGGTIQADACLDLVRPHPELRFSKVEVRGLEIQRLPPSWGLPPPLVGQLKGSAWLAVVLGSGTPRTQGQGAGQVENAFAAGQPNLTPRYLELHARDGGFAFRDRGMATSRKGSLAEADGVRETRLVGPWWQRRVEDVAASKPESGQ